MTWDVTLVMCVATSGSGVPPAGQPCAPVARHASGTAGLATADLFPAGLARLLAAASAERDRHVNDHRQCRTCWAPFPGGACLAEQILGWF